MSVSLVAIVGSLRKASLNRGVFNSATQLLPPGVALREVDLRPVPFYDSDVEAAGDPPAPICITKCG